MPIIASTNSQPRELIAAGNYIGRCYQMVEIGTIEEVLMGVQKTLHKVRIGWELPTELKVFKEENGEQPRVISKEFTLSMHEKSSLRLALKSWRGKDFSEDEAKAFDITKLLGVGCMINIIHKPSKTDPTKIYEEISGITGVPKGVTVPPQINPIFELGYDNFDEQKFNSLPDFIKEKMTKSKEYIAMKTPQEIQHTQSTSEFLNNEPTDDLPF